MWTDTTNKQLFEPITEMAISAGVYDHAQTRYMHSKSMHAKNSLARSIFGADFGLRAGNGRDLDDPRISPRSLSLAPIHGRDPRVIYPEGDAALTDEQRLQYLEVALRHERRKQDAARAKLHTKLRGDISALL